MSEIIDWRYFAWRYNAGDIIDWRNFVTRYNAGDILLTIFCWRYFFRESGIWGAY
jgi:hypothetical protein